MLIHLLGVEGTAYGFEEYGRNPKDFRTRAGQWQELVLMRRELPAR